MDCVHTVVGINDAVDMVRSCAEAYGGTNWMSDAMVGLAFIVMCVFAASMIYLVLHR